MAEKLTKRLVDATQPDPARDVMVWDSLLPGLGLRVKPSGKKSFCLQYRAAGRSRRLTLGAYGAVTVDEARKLARKALAAVADGADPAQERQVQRKAATVAALFARYFEEHAEPKKKASTVRKDRQWVNRLILPALGKRKVKDVSRADIAALHHDLRSTPYQANRVLEILKKAFNLAELWGMRPDGSNPCRHIQKYKEQSRERLLTPEELARLGQALDEAEREGREMPSMVTLFRLLVLTGCRLGEIQNLTWDAVDLEAGCLRLADSKTGAKVVPLGRVALDLLADLPRSPFGGYACPGMKEGRPLGGIHRAWYRIREAAGLPGLRLHDLRHAWASLAASQGLSLATVGAMLGHSRPETTARYQHFLTDSLREAADLVSEKIAAALAKPPVEKVTRLRRKE